MDSWWDLGEGSGYDGAELATYKITCPFCFERGNFSVDHHVEKKKPNSTKILNFDTLKCGSCASYVMVLWSTGEFGGSRPLHAYQTLPWARKLEKFPDYWPAEVGRFWLQARRSLTDENWDAAVVMARSAMQSALRGHGAKGNNLKGEIEDLAKKGLLPPIIQEWSHEVRELGNDSAHPKPGQAPTDPKDARDIVKFLDYLLEYLYDLPNQIAQYRGRGSGAGTP